MLYKIIPQPPYLKGLKELDRARKYDLVKKINNIVNQLQRKEITTQYHNHPLVDYGKKVYELHIEGDVLLVYEYVDDKLILNLLTITDHKELKNPTTKKNIKKKLLNSLEEEFDRQWEEKFGTGDKVSSVEGFFKEFDEMKNFKVNENTKPKKVNISNITLSSLKKLASTSTRATKDQARDFKYATHVDPVASVLEETDKAYLLNICYYRWNEDRTDKVKRFINLWYPKKSTLEGDVYKRVRENKGTNPKIKSRGIRESLSGSEYFTKEEIKTLPRELEDYLQEQPIPKYYDISVEDMGDKQYVLRGNIDYGDLSHDHRYFDNKVKEFFDNKGISVDIYEPDDLRGNDDGDGIYSSAHIIQKSGNRVYVPQDNELDNFID